MKRKFELVDGSIWSCPVDEVSGKAIIEESVIYDNIIIDNTNDILYVGCLPTEPFNVADGFDEREQDIIDRYASLLSKEGCSEIYMIMDFDFKSVSIINFEDGENLQFVS